MFWITSGVFAFVLVLLFCFWSGLRHPCLHLLSPGFRVVGVSHHAQLNYGAFYCTQRVFCSHRNMTVSPFLICFCRNSSACTCQMSMSLCYTVRMLNFKSFLFHLLMNFKKKLLDGCWLRVKIETIPEWLWMYFCHIVCVCVYCIYLYQKVS